jgi:hypothetical protein
MSLSTRSLWNVSQASIIVRRANRKGNLQRDECNANRRSSVRIILIRPQRVAKRPDELIVKGRFLFFASHHSRCEIAAPMFVAVRGTRLSSPHCRVRGIVDVPLAL